MNFDFINELSKLLEENNIFQFTITGSKAIAVALLFFKVVEHFLKNVDGMSDNPRLGNIYWIIASALFIISSSWIMTLFEDLFAIVDVKMGETESSLYLELEEEFASQMERLSEGTGTRIFNLIVPTTFLFFIVNGIVTIVMFFLKIADMSMTAGYLISRLFLIELIKFIFPIVIALNTLDAFKDLFFKWIKRYIGLLVLGIGYIGVIHFCSLLQKALLEQFKAEDPLIFTGVHLSFFALSSIIVVTVVFTTKIKLFATVTSFVNSFFS